MRSLRVKSEILYLVLSCYNACFGFMGVSHDLLLKRNWIILGNDHTTSHFQGGQWLSCRVLDLRLRAVGSSLTGVTVLCP